MQTRVLVVDDHKLFREGIKNLLQQAPDIAVIDEAKDGNEAIEKVKFHELDLVLIDIAMPNMDGIQATKLIKASNPDIKVIGLSMHKDQQFIHGLLQAGADGYLLKDSTYDQLVSAIKSVADGKKFLGPDVTSLVIDGFLKPNQVELDEYDELSEREKEIFLLFAKGEATRTIGETLFISPKTVGTHKINILNKLNLQNSADMTKYAIKKGLIDLD